MSAVALNHKSAITHLNISHNYKISLLYRNEETNTYKLA